MLNIALRFVSKQLKEENYFILCLLKILIGGDVKWSKEKDGKLPKKAIVGGKTSTGEALYIGRANHEKSVTVGKIQPSHKCLYIPYGGKEVAIKEYEVLVEK